MDFSYLESFTPWETPNFQDKCINYLRKPQQLFLRSPQRFNKTVHTCLTQSKEIQLPSKQIQFVSKEIQLTSKQIIVSKENKNYFIERNKLNSRNRLSRNMSKVQLKKSHQSLHFSREANKLPANQTKQEHHTKQPFHTLTNFSVKRKSLKEKIQKTKKLLQKNQTLKTSQFREKLKQEKVFEQSLQRLLCLSKSHHNLNASLPLNPSVIDNFFQTKIIVRNHNRGKNSCNDMQNSKETTKDSQMNKSVNFLQSKTNMAYIKKKACNKTFYKQGNNQKIMNLPKIQILDWEKPQM